MQVSVLRAALRCLVRAQGASNLGHPAFSRAAETAGQAECHYDLSFLSGGKSNSRKSVLSLQLASNRPPCKSRSAIDIQSQMHRIPGLACLDSADRAPSQALPRPKIRHLALRLVECADVPRGQIS